MRGLVAGAAMAMVGAAPPAERIVSGDAVMPVTVAGRPLRLRIEPSMPGIPLIVPARARELGLKGGGMFGVGVCYRIGRERICGATHNVGFGPAGGRPDKRRVGWMSRDHAAFADGTIGPGGLPEPIVRFQLRPARAGEQSVAVPLDMPGGLSGSLFGSWFALDGVLAVAGAPMRLRFDPYHPMTLVTAPAALALARSHGGTMTRETGRQQIAFGIERPYRIMQLARPLTIGGIRLSRLGVRITDEDVAGRIAEADAPADADPDEVDERVTVTASARRKPRIGLLLLGADALAACSSLTFDKPAKQVRLECGP